ncbi:MAG: hypothetical protein WC447_00325 [Candidatus Paceibacterota bacterium]|jgi:hypothetical protein
MNYIKKNLPKIILVTFILALPILSLAQNGTNPPPAGNGTNPPATGNVKIVNPIHSETLTGLIKTILEGVIKIGMPIIVLAIIYSGFLFVRAQGNSEKLNEAKRTLLYTLIGAAILLGSWGIALLITNTVKAL